MNSRITSYTSRISEYAFIAYFFILSFFPFSADIIKLLCLLTVIGCWIARMLVEKKILFAKTPLNIPIISFLLCSMIASFHSVSIKHSLETVLHDYFVYFIIFFCMVNNIHSRKQIERMVKSMLITCGLVCAYGLYGFYTGIAIRDGRLVATFGYHTLISEYISLLLPIAICLFFWFKDILTRLYLALLIFICCFSLILTMSRASWIAIVITIFFIGFAVQRKLLILIFVSVCALLIFILPSKFTTHAKTTVQIDKFLTSSKIFGERLLCWKASIAMIKDHPILGIGPGERNFRYAYQQYGKEVKNKELQQKGMKESSQSNVKKTRIKKIQRLSNAHNIFLHVWVGTGVVGLVIFLWLFVLVFYSGIKLLKSLSMEYEKMLLIGIMASIISFFSQGVVHNLWKKPDAVFLWYIMGILFVVIRNNFPLKKQTNSNMSSG